MAFMVLRCSKGMESPKRLRYSGPKVRKMSFMVVISEPPHGRVDEFEGIFGTLLGEMEVDHGGFEICVPHVALDDSGIDAGF